MFKASKPVLVCLVFTGSAMVAANVRQDDLEAARRAYEASEYTKAIECLLKVAGKDPKDGELQLLLTKSYLELQEHDAAIRSAEKAVGIDPQNSRYHEWLGRAYGEKADHAGLFSAMSLAKKTRKEFERAVELDQRNFSARQALIEFDCSAPGMVGGGEEKAQPQIRELAGMDVAEGYYAAGNCRRQKKDFAQADAECTKALESRPKSAELICDIGDYAVKRSQSERLRAVAEAGERVAPDDPRAKFSRGVGLFLGQQSSDQAERLLEEYAKKAPKRNGYPTPATAHVWLGRLYESQGRTGDAEKAFEEALRLDPRNKLAQEAVKKIKKN